MLEDLPYRGIVVASCSSHPVEVQETLRQLQDEAHVHPLENWAAWSDAGEMRRQQWQEAADRTDAGRVVTDSDALEVFGATYELVERMILDREVTGSAGVYFNPVGGEHSEQHEGVSKYNDSAYAAIRLSELGYNVLVLDLDAHHGIETESMMRDRKVLTVSIHESSTAATPHSSLEDGFMNYPLDTNTTSLKLFDYINQTEKAAHVYYEGAGIDVLIVVAGSDTITGGDLLALEWGTETFAALGNRLGRWASLSGASMLVLGAGSGGLDRSPTSWCNLLVGLETGQVLGGLDQILVQG